MASENLHEREEALSDATKNMHRGIVSLIEELEAVDWYQQRAEACSDDELRAVLIHNKNEEIEHAMMTLEWIRRKHPVFDETIRTYLMSEGPITAVEASKDGGDKAPDGRAAGAPARAGDGSLGIGSLKGA